MNAMQAPSKYPWFPYAQLASIEKQWAERALRRGGWHLFVYEFLRFGVKEAWACLFGGLMLALLLGTHFWYPAHAPLARYDFLAISAVLVQVLLLACRMETWDEAKVILLYHVIGTAMEIFKTQMGSWSYPEAGFIKIAGVPLFSGFMYACVGSYIARAWRIFDLRFHAYPPFWATVLLAVAIYANFFTHHYFYDFRWWLFAATAILYGRAWVNFRIHRHWRRMPMLLAFLLIALFIWLAENLGTFSHAWLYPSQKNGWHMVSVQKFGSWYLLMLVSFVMVSLVNKPKRD
jgi:uncharacterized membrane protein YoaT (DUF817 family)